MNQSFQSFWFISESVLLSITHFKQKKSELENLHVLFRISWTQASLFYRFYQVRSQAPKTSLNIWINYRDFKQTWIGNLQSSGRQCYYHIVLEHFTANFYDSKHAYIKKLKTTKQKSSMLFEKTLTLFLKTHINVPSYSLPQFSQLSIWQITL